MKKIVVVLLIIVSLFFASLPASAQSKKVAFGVSGAIFVAGQIVNYYCDKAEIIEKQDISAIDFSGVAVNASCGLFSGVAVAASIAKTKSPGMIIAGGLMGSWLSLLGQYGLVRPKLEEGLILRYQKFF